VVVKFEIDLGSFERDIEIDACNDLNGLELITLELPPSTSMV
jgi:hypothetical protein